MSNDYTDGIFFLKQLKLEKYPIVFFDPQYRSLLDKLRYGNEGSRQKKRFALPQMSDSSIGYFIKEIDRILIPKGHLFLWVDKFILCEGICKSWIENTQLNLVDMITWDKVSMGMGYRTRRQTEFLLVIQKNPKRAKGVWLDHSIRDIYREKSKRLYPHRKPISLQQKLIESCSQKGDTIVDPASGSCSVEEACQKSERHFLGFDINNA